LLEVATRKLHPHNPEFFNVNSVPFDYDESAPPSPRWRAFLDQLWPDDNEAIRALQEVFGYILSGHTDQQKIFLLIGPIRSGKGTITRVLGALVGRGNMAGPTMSSLGGDFGLQPLLGKSLAVISDARLGNRNADVVVERLLSISGEDSLTVDRKHRESWTGRLPCRFVVLSNELPRLGDASGAIATRCVVLQLTQSWLGKEDPALTDALLTELPGILNWSLDGLDRLLERGRFIEPKSSQDAVAALADLVSPVSAFVRDCCVLGPHESIECGLLFTVWRNWCESTGERPGTVQTFGRDLRARLPGVRGRKPHGGSRQYVGIAVRKGPA
jgi:putative DNA primase/helicase